MQTIFFNPITHKEVYNTIMSMKNLSAPGYDEISITMFKKYVNIITKPFKYLINKIFERGPGMF